MGHPSGQCSVRVVTAGRISSLNIRSEASRCSHLVPLGPLLRKPGVQQLFRVLWVLLLITELVLGMPREVFMEKMMRTEETVRTSGLEEGSCRFVNSRCKTRASRMGACPTGEEEMAGEIRGRLGPHGLEPHRPPQGNSTFTPRRKAVNDLEE